MWVRPRLAREMAHKNDQKPTRSRRPTSTTNFGTGRRESHDSSGFYERFSHPTLSDDAVISGSFELANPFQNHDARSMNALPDASVALVVTSPPYFAGKQYEQDLEHAAIPSSYLEYLDMLRSVFKECVRVLEPGGRIAVNVANLGRKPFRSLAADVIAILQDDLGLLLRGEIVWQKAEGSSGSCAWGSYKKAVNPVLRDVTERVVVASKGRFDRAVDSTARQQRGLPHKSTIMTDDFLNLTLDLWQIPTESAKRVGHPAPFPAELPEKLIELYTYEGDLVLDPFVGSGSTLVAASRLKRRYVGYDLDASYLEIAKQRVSDEGQPVDQLELQSLSKLCIAWLEAHGYDEVEEKIRFAGMPVRLAAKSAEGTRTFFVLGGENTRHRPGVHSADVTARVIGRAVALRAAGAESVKLLTPALPPKGSEADKLLSYAKESFDEIILVPAAT